VDPHAGLVPGLFGPPGPDSARAWGLALVELCRDRVAVVKPQAGLFERWGAAGVAAMEDVCKAARAAGLLVILDAKRGDIGSTAEGSARAYLAADAPCPCDALTVNPWMGLDTVEPFLAQAEANGKGVAVLARTSNPGSADFQARVSEGRPLYMHVAAALAGLAPRLRGPASGWSGLMLVAGATGPEEARAMRAAAPHCLFLVPGYGAQGGDAADAVASFVSGPNGLEGGVVNASRSVTAPAEAHEAASAKSWETAIRTAIEAAQRDLAAAIAG
jgi:orotidine-5'-phosphate decarboxylase